MTLNFVDLLTIHTALTELAATQRTQLNWYSAESDQHAAIAEKLAATCSVLCKIENTDI